MLRHSLHNSFSRKNSSYWNNFQFSMFVFFIIGAYISQCLSLSLHRCYSIIENFRPLSLLTRGYFDLTFSVHSITCFARKHSKDTQATPMFWTQNWNFQSVAALRISCRFQCFSFPAPVHTQRRPHYASKFENALSLWERIKCFSSTLRRRSLKSNSQRSFWICHSVIEIIA